jgi:Domain of unknown function (DUF4157)
MENQNLIVEKKPTEASKGSFFKPVIQKKLSIGSPNDSYEAEADHVADKVMRMKEPTQQNVTQTGSLIQKKCTHCQEEELRKKPLAESITPLIQRRSTESGGESHAPSHVESQINSSRGGGSVMDHGTQHFMESRFGTDFSGVRIHTGSQAVQMSKELDAQAFTVGNDVYFNEGKYTPNSDSGRHLLAHELTHTVQQNGGIGRKIQKNPIAVGAGIGAAAFLAGYGLAFVADYLSMTRARALRFATSMGTGWLSSLPNCPCSAPVSDIINWERDASPSLSTYHPGAVSSFRSTPHLAPGRHGQQCTYDAANSLIKSGPGAGTPDYYAPRGTDIPYHIVYDVKTWQELGSSTYNSYWVPNTGVGCP